MKKRQNPVPDPSSDLIVCGKHGIMLMQPEDDHRTTKCPSCELHIDAYPERYDGGRITDMEFRNRISWETMQELVPLMRKYLAAKERGPMFITCASWPKDTPLPSGYNEVERFFNVFAYQWDPLVKYITEEYSARKTITSLRQAGFS